MEPLLPPHFTTGASRNKTPPEQQQSGHQQPMTPTTPTPAIKQIQGQQDEEEASSRSASAVCPVPAFQLFSSPGTITVAVSADNEGARQGRSVTTSTALQKHCAFFDLDGDGVLVPWDTFFAFRQLGYGLLMSLMGTILTHLAMSYPTQPSWIPDPFFSIHLNAIHRCIHGSDTGTYLPDGTLQKERLVTLLNKFISSPSTPSPLSMMDVKVGWREGLQITEQMRNLYDFFGW